MFSPATAPWKNGQMLDMLQNCRTDLPLDAVFVPLLDEPDALQHIGDVVNPPLLPHIQGVRGLGVGLFKIASIHKCLTKL